MMRSPSDRWIVLFFALFIPVFFPKIFYGFLPGPFEVERGDAFIFFEPYALEFTRSLKSGSNPFWSHASSFGSPTLMTLGTGALHPFNLLHLVMPDWLSFAIGLWLRVAVCGAYIYLYLKNKQVQSWLAIASTLSFLFGSFNINYSQEIIGFVMCFFPMMLYYTERLCRDETPSATTVIMLGFSTFFVLLGGFLSVVLYFFLAISFYALVQAKQWKRLMLVGIACLIGIMGALPMVVETLAFFPGTGYDPAQRAWLFFYDPPAMTALNLVIPSIFGGSTEYGAAGMRDFYGSQLGAGVFAVPILIVLAFRMLFSKNGLGPDLTFWIVTLLFSLALYFNVLKIKIPLSYVPIINEHPFTRLQTLIALSATLAAALAIDRYIKCKPSKTEWLGILLGAAGIAAVAYIVALLEFDGLATRSYLVTFGLLTVLVFAALAASYLWQSTGTQIAFVLSCGAVCWATSWTYVSYYQPKDYYPITPAVKTIKARIAPGARVLDVEDTLFRGAAIAYGIPSITNHWFSQPVLRAWVQKLSGAPPTPGLTLDRISSIDLPTVLPELRRMHVQFVVRPRGSLPQLETHGGTSWRLLNTDDSVHELIEILYDGRPLDLGGGLSGLGYSQFRVEDGDLILSPQSLAFTLPVRYDPGWSSTTPGVTLQQDSEHLIHVKVPAGTKKIRLTYLPARILPTVVLGAFGIALLLTFALFLLRSWTPDSPRVETPT